MAQGFKPEPKMETTEPKVELKLKKGGSAMPKGLGVTGTDKVRPMAGAQPYATGGVAMKNAATGGVVVKNAARGGRIPKAAKPSERAIPMAARRAPPIVDVPKDPAMAGMLPGGMKRGGGTKMKGYAMGGGVKGMPSCGHKAMAKGGRV